MVAICLPSTPHIYIPVVVVVGLVVGEDGLRDGNVGDNDGLFGELNQFASNFSESITTFKSHLLTPDSITPHHTSSH